MRYSHAAFLAALLVGSAPAYAAELTLVHDIQGNGSSSPLSNNKVTVEAVVVGDFQGSDGLSGFFIQEEDVDADADAATSEGIFVYDGNGNTAVAEGDLVQVTGTVKEYNGLTELSNVSVTVVSQGNALPAATDVQLPFATADELERYEGMLIHLSQTLTVTENYNLGRYGEVWLSSGGRLMAPTAVAAPGADALAVQEANDLNRILLDDRSRTQNPDPILYPAPELTASNTLRSGDTVTGVVGVLDFAFDTYRLHPTETPAFVHGNARSSAPADVSGSLRVASFNVLNYFNGDGQGGGFPTARGANTLEELERQRDKIVAAITAMEADIIGLMEIENDGYGANSAIQDLVNGLNAAAPSGTSYDFIDPGVSQIGSDDIAVGLIYRLETVAPAGGAAILDSSVDARFDDSKNRPALAQTFDELATGGRLTIAVNHLKSKGSSCDNIGDPDAGDGQGNCNLTRTSAAAALVDWLATDPTGSGDADALIIGDLNAYAQEDPVVAIESGGYTDLLDLWLGADTVYSYVFMGQAGYLDHALANSDLAGQVTGVTAWHSNADEPRVLDYNTEYKTQEQLSSLYAPDAYRASDHDAVLVGLSLSGGSTEPPPEGSTMHVADLDSQTQSQGGEWIATVTITVVDEYGQAVASANASGTWTGSNVSSTSSCTTGSNGRCSVSLRMAKRIAEVTFTVDGMTHASLSYDASSNSDPDGDSDGTSITVLKP